MAKKVTWLFFSKIFFLKTAILRYDNSSESAEIKYFWRPGIAEVIKKLDVGPPNILVPLA